MSSSPSTSYTCTSSTSEPFDQPGLQRRVHAGSDLQPDDLPEAPPPELVLDRLEQVVGLVGDLEVGVARDPEQIVR